MSLIIQQNTPTIVDLANEARSIGWSLLPNGTAHHETCNSGFISIKNTLLTVVQNNVYTVSYQITDYVSGQLVLHVGNSVSVARTANGNYVDTLTATGTDPEIRIFSNGNLNLALLDVKTDTASTVTKQRNTFSFDENTNKWPSYSSATSDFGFSLFKDLFTFKNGRLYKHDSSLPQRNTIYGVEYDTVVNIPFGVIDGQPKTFESVSFEANQLLITTDDGIRTSLGQISELKEANFLVEALDDGINQINIYDKEGIYSASFVREKPDVVNGTTLKGTFITVELITVGNGILSLKNVMVNSVVSKIGSR